MFKKIIALTITTCFIFAAFPFYEGNSSTLNQQAVRKYSEMLSNVISTGVMNGKHIRSESIETSNHFAVIDINGDGIMEVLLSVFNWEKDGNEIKDNSYSDYLLYWEKDKVGIIEFKSVDAYHDSNENAFDTFEPMSGRFVIDRCILNDFDDSQTKMIYQYNPESGVKEVGGIAAGTDEARKYFAGDVYYSPKKVGLSMQNVNTYLRGEGQSTGSSVVASPEVYQFRR